MNEAEKKIVNKIDALIAAAPDLEGPLENVKKSVFFTAPESMGIRWEQVYEVLSEHGLDHPMADELMKILEGEDMKWEYLIIETMFRKGYSSRRDEADNTDEFTAVLNGYGKQGWELVGFQESEDFRGGYMVFKREATNPDLFQRVAPEDETRGAAIFEALRVLRSEVRTATGVLTNSNGHDVCAECQEEVGKPRVKGTYCTVCVLRTVLEAVESTLPEDMRNQT